MKKEITTKDLSALNELMTYENWIASKMQLYSEITTSNKLKKEYKDMANKHAILHKNLLNYLNSNAN